MYENTIVSIPYSHNLWKTLSEALCTTILPPESAIIHPTDRPSDQLGNRGSPNKANPERGKTGSLGSLGTDGYVYGIPLATGSFVVEFTPNYFK